MTIQEALDRVDLLKPNKVETEAKIAWLSKLDGIVWREIILTHECPPDMVDQTADDDTQQGDGFAGYDMTTDPGTELLVKAPYDEDLYFFYLAGQVDIVNMETQKYANDHALFNAAYNTFQNAYNRKYMPLQKVKGFHT